MYLIIFTDAIYASTYSLSKYLLTYMQPLYLSGLRMTIAGCILLIYLGLFDYARFIIHKKSLSYFFILAFFNIFLTFALELWALQYISSIKVTFLYNLGPLITPFFSYFFFSEIMTLKMG